MDKEDKSENAPNNGRFIVVQDSLNLWHWRLVNSVDKELYTSVHSYTDKDTAIMIGQSYGHIYVGN